MSANLSAVFNSQFFAPAVDGVAMVAADFSLYAYLSGTTTPHDTFTDPDGLVPNTNPIVLDDDGRCTMFLDPAVLYTFVLKDTLGATVNTWDDVGAAALTTGTVVSINGLTGIVVLDASGIPYTTSSSAVWLTADNVESALDQIADRANAPPADSVTVADAGDFYDTPKNVENILQQLGERHGALLRITTFTASGTWTKQADTSFVVVEGVGGGGGSTSSTGSSGCGGGGGAGGYFKKLVAAPGATEAVTIGAGGAVGASGGVTSFGSWATANGGQQGGVNSGGAGGTAAGGDINIAGGGGGYGLFISGGGNFYGAGGNSAFGGGAPGTDANANGAAGATGTGGGGSGGTSTGAAGGSGRVNVYEYS
jgi:hypothetical protein